MKKVGIDARLYHQTGVGTYLRNLLHFLHKKRQTDTAFYIYALPGDIADIKKLYPYFTVRQSPYLWHSFSEQTLFYYQLKQDAPDLMHFTYFGYPVLYRKKCIVTIHDMTPLLFRTGKASTQNKLIYGIKHLAFRYIFRSQIMRSSHIITPSQTVKNQLTQFYKVNKTKITALYEGVGYELKQAEPNMNMKKICNDPFYMYVGNFYPHKNVARLLNAYTQAGLKKKLILVGPEDYFTHQLKKNLPKQSQHQFIFYHNPSFEDLAFLYRTAKGLIHPSLSEGFGLPLIEAAFFNCPIIASDIEVFRELFGKSYTSFNPYSTDDMARAIAQFDRQPKTYDYDALMEKYQFETMAQQTLILYKRLLNNQE